MHRAHQLHDAGYRLHRIVSRYSGTGFYHHHEERDGCRLRNQDKESGVKKRATDTGKRTGSGEYKKGLGLIMTRI